MATHLKVGQKVDLALIPLCSGNCPGSVNGTPTWGSSNDTIASIQSTSNGGLAARIIANATGSCTITATAVGQSGNIVKTVDIVVGNTYATTAEVSISEPIN